VAVQAGHRTPTTGHAQSVIYHNALAAGIARGFLAAAGIALGALAIAVIAIRIRHGDLAGPAAAAGGRPLPVLRTHLRAGTLTAERQL